MSKTKRFKTKRAQECNAGSNTSASSIAFLSPFSNGHAHHAQALVQNAKRQRTATIAEINDYLKVGMPGGAGGKFEVKVPCLFTFAVFRLHN